MPVEMALQAFYPLGHRRPHNVYAEKVKFHVLEGLSLTCPIFKNKQVLYLDLWSPSQAGSLRFAQLPASSRGARLP